MSLSIERLPFLCLLVILSLLGCEGGKNNNSCPPNASGPYKTSCPATNPGATNGCPAGQELVKGICQTSKPSCPSNQNIEDGKCVTPCPPLTHREGGVCVDDDVKIEMVGAAACSASNGYKQIILQFIARDEKGNAIDPELDVSGEPTALNSEILIDGEPADLEFAIDRESELLKSDLVLSLVLDSSGSMLPVFDTVKEAAKSILQQTKSKWKDNNSTFDWRLLWFNDYLYEPAADPDGLLWSIADIDHIPRPAGGTELYKGIYHMLGVHQDLFDIKKAVGTRDRHVMIVLSDGKDNHSDVDNTLDEDTQKPHIIQKNLNNQLFWTEFGSPAVDKASLLKALAASQQNLKVHVIGFGKDVVESSNGFVEELKSMASAGRGNYFDGGSTTEALKQVFEDVKKEFITLQTIGITASLPNGRHEFNLKVKHIVSLAEGTSIDPFVVDTGTLKPCE